jgi:hypothetical protein
MVAAPKPAPKLSWIATRRQSRSATLQLADWIKTHRFLRAVPLEQGEPSVALLLLWEADHGISFPSRAVEFSKRLSTFAKRLSEAVAADDELRSWLETRVVNKSLALGLPTRAISRWAIHIDPGVGDPFLSAWKAHLAVPGGSASSPYRCTSCGWLGQPSSKAAPA